MSGTDDPENPYRPDTGLGRLTQMVLGFQRWERSQRKPAFGGPPLETTRQLEGQAEPGPAPKSRKGVGGQKGFDYDPVLLAMAHAIQAEAATGPEAAVKLLLRQQTDIPRKPGTDEDSVVSHVANLYREADRSGRLAELVQEEAVAGAAPSTD
jgi:hypothetical protein